MVLSLISLLVSCSPVNNLKGSILNSRYSDEQPALSGNGQLISFVSNRDGKQQIIVYDLLKQEVVTLPHLSQGREIAENPSLSRTGRYLTYIANYLGRPEIILYDRATQREEVLTRGYRGWLRNPKISVDGRYVVFETSRRGQWDIEVLDRGPNIELDITDDTGRWRD